MNKAIIPLLLLVMCLFGTPMFAQNMEQLSIDEIDSIADVFLEDNNFQEALPYALKSVELSEKIAIDSNYAAGLNYLGYVYQGLGDYEKAEKFYIEALAIEKKEYGNDYVLAGSSTNDLAYLYMELGEHEKAESYFLEMVSAIKKSEGTEVGAYAEAINSLAILYLEMSDYAAAEPLFKKALVLNKKVYGEESIDYAAALGNLGLLYSEKGQYKEAEICMVRSSEIDKLIEGEHSMVYATSLNNLASLYETMGQYPKAESIYLEGIAIDAEVYGKDNHYYATSVNNLSQLYEIMGRFEESKVLCLESMGIREKVFGKMHYTYASSLHSLAKIYSSMGDYEAAEPLYVQAIEIDKKALGEEHPSYGTVLNDLAELYVDMKDYEAAEVLFTQAIEIRKKVLGEKHADYGKSIQGLASMFVEIGDYQAAEPLAKQALAIQKEALGYKHPAYASSLNDLAGLYLYMENYDISILFFEEALAIRKEVFGTLHADYAETLNDLANAYASVEEYEKAEKLYLKTLAIDEKTHGQEHPEYAISLDNLGFLYLGMEEYEKAEELFFRGLEINKSTFGERHPSVANALNNIGILNVDLDDLEVARGYFRKAILANCKSEKLVEGFVLSDMYQYDFYSNENLLSSLDEMTYISIIDYEDTEDQVFIEDYYELSKLSMYFNSKMREELRGTEDKLRALSAMSTLVDQSISTALMLSTNDNKKKYAAEAFSFAEENKSILLADAIKGNRARGLGDLPKELAMKEQKMDAQLSVLKKAEIQARSEAEKKDVIAKLNRLNLEMEAFKLSLKDKYPKYHALKYENITAQAEDLQEIMDEETALLEYFAADSVTYLFYVDKKQVQVFEIPISKRKMHREVKVLRKVLSEYKYIVQNRRKTYNQFVESAYWFYEKLVAPGLELSEGIKNLVIVPDYELGHLPFEVFLMEGGSQKEDYEQLHYLVHDYNISYNYSATLWNENMKRNVVENHSTSGQMLAMAADYYGVDTNLTSIRSPYAMSLRKSLNPLAAAQEEVQSLAEHYAGDFLFGENVNESFFKKNAANYDVIHLAMHGILDRRTPILSSLAFTENRDSLQDNFLQAYEISHLKLNAGLVVLSACETGYGKFEQGEGVLSLARSFMYAGVPSLVVSLWQVSDQSTALIMQTFYKELAEGKPKDEALRLAKLDYMKKAQGLARHPAFWSAFIQIGDNKPVYLSDKYTGNKWWWTLGGLSIFLGGFFVVRRIKTT